MTPCQPVMVPVPAPQRTARLRLVPAVLELMPDDWARFSRADRDLLARLLREPVDYVDDPLFHQSDAEQRLFGRWVLLAGNETRFAPLPPPIMGEKGILSPKQGMLLFQQLNYARMRQQRLLRQFRHKRMPLRELHLLLAWAHLQTEARNQIVEANMPLVLAMMKRIRVTGLDFSDLASEGNLALLRCVDQFNCSLGFRFSTYACRAILKSFARVGIKTSLYRGRFPVMLNPALASGDRSECRHDEAETMCLEEVRKILAENRAELTAQECTVLGARFALCPSPPGSLPQTLEQAGHLISVTKERVRQIQKKALQKLRAALEDSLIRISARP